MLNFLITRYIYLEDISKTHTEYIPRPRTLCGDLVVFHRRPLNGDGKIIQLCDLCVSSEAGGGY
jgi:hypothetical protein